MKNLSLTYQKTMPGHPIFKSLVLSDVHAGAHSGLHHWLDL